MRYPSAASFRRALEDRLQQRALGGVESLISHPASMTHAAVPVDHRNALGLTDDLLRLSCGVEDVGDLIADLERALA